MANSGNDDHLERSIARGIWRQKNQEFALKLFIGLIVLPALFIWSAVVYLPRFAPTYPHPTPTQTQPK